MTQSDAVKVAVLCGGVGAAKLLKGLIHIIDPKSITAIVNTGDDLVLHGLHISPDLDTVTYTLADEINPDTGWGLRNEGWRAMEMVSMYGGIDWFRLGDRDLGTHLYRTQRLSEGAPLSEVTKDIAKAWGVDVNIVPMSDDPVRTIVTTVDGDEIAFQDYFVRLSHDITVTDISFNGCQIAKPNKDVIDKINNADVILIAPSNPLVSIAPILSIDAISNALQMRRDNVVAISGIVNGKAIKGPAERLLRELGHEPSAVGVARIYKEIAGTFVIDELDLSESKRVRQLGMDCMVLDTMMTSVEKATNLCKSVLEGLRK